jgi:trk system potassium uptake protein
LSEGEHVLVLIAGCGRVGSTLAVTLSRDDHEVVVIDKNPASFRRLGDDFKGTAMAGIVFDRESLEAAGIRRAQVFVAVTSGDNSNIVAARTARERFGVERVVARIYDPARAEIFERMGVSVVASARWTVETIIRTLNPGEERIEGTIGPGVGDVLMLTMRVPSSCRGVEAEALMRPGESVLTAVTRAGNTRVPGRGGLLEAGDLVHLAVERSALDSVRRAVGLLGAGGDHA